MSRADRARTYAQAFHEAAMDRWLAALQAVSARLAEDRGLRERLQATDVDFGERQPLLDEVLPAEADPSVRNLLYTLMQRSDLEMLGEVIETLRQQLRRAEAEPTMVEVTSAVPLNAEQRGALASRLEAQYGAGLHIGYRVDPAILGGVIVRVGDKLIDGSLATRMAAMKHALGVVDEGKTQNVKRKM
jgi:F-type H+-transporting ATPase subunit delta